jgi:hypothetical protein
MAEAMTSNNTKYFRFNSILLNLTYAGLDAGRARVSSSLEDGEVPLAGRADSGHRVNAAFVPGMAASNTFDAKPTTLLDPIFGDGFIGVVGTGRIIATIAPHQWRDEALIEPNQCQEQATG